MLVVRYINVDVMLCDSYDLSCITSISDILDNYRRSGLFIVDCSFIPFGGSSDVY